VDAEPVLDAAADSDRPVTSVKEADSEAKLFADAEDPLAEAERVRDSAAALETAPIAMHMNHRVNSGMFDEARTHQCPHTRYSRAPARRSH
jgi:hypothetical protein